VNEAIRSPREDTMRELRQARNLLRWQQAQHTLETGEPCMVEVSCPRCTGFVDYDVNVDGYGGLLHRLLTHIAKAHPEALR
jgi:hypothetical protein